MKRNGKSILYIIDIVVIVLFILIAAERRGYKWNTFQGFPTLCDTLKILFLENCKDVDRHEWTEN